MIMSFYLENIKEKKARGKCLEQIAELLNGGKTKGFCKSNYYCEFTLQLQDIDIKIEEVGNLIYPITETFIEKLKCVSTKAHFGLRDQTLVDETVRKSHVIASDKLDVTINEKVFHGILEKVAVAMGFTRSKSLSAELHNMLIYAPGHFFDTHQDSEKVDHMIATLVIVLPTAHIGGDLVISHCEEKYIFSTEALKPENIKCIAFFADCLHKVEKVKDGHRIALTYNIILQSGTPVIPVPDPMLKSAVNSYFEVANDNLPVLVYFLNHTYTQPGLRWDMLKGEDCESAMNIYSVAKQLQLLPYLALVKIHETWNAPEEDELEDIIDSDMTLKYWIDSENKQVAFQKYHVDKKEVSYNKENNAFKPFREQYEDYTGNAGSTMEYWYRRAAVVLWPEVNKIGMDFKLRYKESLKELCSLILNSGNEVKVLERITKAGNHLKYDAELFSTLGSIAIYIKNAETAFSLLSKFKWNILSRDVAVPLLNLQSNYGCDWCIRLMISIKDSSLCVIQNFDCFIESLLKNNITDSIIKFLQEVQLEALKKSSGSCFYTFSSPLENMYNLLRSCILFTNKDIIENAVNYLLSNSKLCSVLSLAKLYIKLSEALTRTEMLYFSSLKNELFVLLGEKEAALLKSLNDFSVKGNITCSCEYCREITRFLLSNELTKVWPLQERIRRHIKQNIMRHKKVLAISELKNGPPHSLVINKIKQSAKYHEQKDLNEVKSLIRQLKDLDNIECCEVLDTEKRQDVEMTSQMEKPRLKEFKTIVSKLFKEENGQSVPLQTLKEFVFKQDVAQPFSPEEINSALESMAVANQVIVANHIVFLI